MGCANRAGRAVEEHMLSIEIKASELHPPTDWNEKRGITVVVHVDDFLCAGGVEGLMWLHVTWKDKYDLKKHVLQPGSQK